MNTISVDNTFAVSNVVPATEPLPTASYLRAVADFLGSPVEACSRYHGTLVASIRAHPLIGALHAGFATHRPVSLSPDIIWLTLCQGFAHHVNANSEALRHRLVDHEGKLAIKVRRDAFVKGSPENDWPDVFSEFSAAVRAHLGESHDLLLADFSTTGPVERAASELVLLDAMQSFLNYEIHTLCGIPAITLEGTPEDWKEIARRAMELSRFDLEWWIEPLLPVLQQFTAAAEGNVDRQFWDSIYKWQGPAGSGSPHVSGWILNLFPYLHHPDDMWTRLLDGKALPLQRNPWLSLPPSRRGPGRDDFPSSPAKVPFLWQISGRAFRNGVHRRVARDQPGFAVAPFAARNRLGHSRSADNRRGSAKSACLMRGSPIDCPKTPRDSQENAFRLHPKNSRH